ncbi:MAG TPA: catalase [Pseudonocardiaceae bacterium]|jgi:catalase|nr:catalase [Pseudonocardiaceae bacterium]
MTAQPTTGVTADGMTAEQAIDRIEAAGHPRAQDRRLHARGSSFEARFIPAQQVKGLTVAEHLTTEGDAVIRFSNGLPQIDADDRERGVRGMAVKFLGADGQPVADLVAANFRVFPSRTPEGFIELVEALSEATADGTLAERAKGKLAAAGKFASLLAHHPESYAGLKAFIARQAPASFATTRYDGLHAFHLVDADGNRQAFRYRLIPQLGEIDLTPDHAKTLTVDYLLGELDARLAAGPVSFTLVFQLADPGDQTSDPSSAWPEHRRLIPAGTFQVLRRSPKADEWEHAVFDPTNLAPGVETSDDPILRFRPYAYSVSASRRLG